MVSYTNVGLKNFPMVSFVLSKPACSSFKIATAVNVFEMLPALNLSVGLAVATGYPLVMPAIDFPDAPFHDHFPGT